MKWLIPPTSFSEGQRALYGCAVVCAGLFAGFLCLVYTVIFVGGVHYKLWPTERIEQILNILGYAFGGFVFAMIAVIVMLAVGGPVGRFKGGLSLKDGFNLDAGKDDGPSVETKTTTTVKGVQDDKSGL